MTKATFKVLGNPQVHSLLLGLSALAALGIALFTQLQWGWVPCALCVLQRIGFLGIAAAGLAGAFVRHKAVWVLHLGCVTGLLGAAMAHVSLLSKPAQGCSFDPLGMEINLSWIGQTLGWLLQSEGTCWQTGIELLGMHMSTWSFIYAVGALGVVLYNFLPDTKTTTH